MQMSIVYSVEELRNELDDYNMARMNSFCEKKTFLSFSTLSSDD